jgi:leucyl aminopeptidase
MLEIQHANWKTWKGAKDTVAILAFQEEAGPRLLGLPTGNLAKVLQEIAQADGFKGKEGETLLVRPPDQAPAERVVLVGLGKKAEFTLEALRKAAATAVKKAESLGLRQMAIRVPQLAKTPRGLSDEVQALSEGLLLGSYRFDKHRKEPEDTPKPLSTATVLSEGSAAPAVKGIEHARIFSAATVWVRDLVNEPPSLMNPERLAQEALKLNKKPISVQVFERAELEKLGMGGLLGVGAGGAVSPRLVELHYKPSKPAKKTVALVGKGITFDSGGLSLKTAQHMETMKMDMAGAATVLGVISALPSLGLPVEVRGYMALAENMPGGRATKPGDILKTFSGKTIEVLNTDAEGRIVLADALAYASSKKPDVIIDIATLTGACVVALGSSVSGVLGNNRRLVQAILSAADDSGEKFWELPLVKEYREDIKSKVADVKNIGTRRGEAGAIIGGLFLQEFADHPAWVHLDIAGPAWVDSDQPYRPAGATGHPVRTLLHCMERL